jgi:peroxiredoxin
MIELGELERHHADFEKRNTRVVAVSLEGLEEARQTKDDYPHLEVVSDKDRKLSEAVQIIHKDSNPHGGDTASPTTILVDPQGKVRWYFHPDRFIERLSPSELLAQID